MKFFFTIVFILLCATLLFTQNRNNRHFIEGSCRSIVNHLRELKVNDSIAIETFFKDYIILNNRNFDRDSLRKRNYFDIIHFINSSEGKDCYCRSRFIKRVSHEEMLTRYFLLTDTLK